MSIFLSLPIHFSIISYGSLVVLHILHYCCINESTNSFFFSYCFLDFNFPLMCVVLIFMSMFLVYTFLLSCSLPFSSLTLSVLDFQYLGLWLFTDYVFSDSACL